MNRAIFIDRDGVINKWTEPEDKDYGPNWYCLSWDDFEFLPGVFEAFEMIATSDYRPIIVSNQSCIGKGYVDYQLIRHIFNRMITKLNSLHDRSLVRFLFCPHDTDQNCACRKPKPFMLGKAAIEHDICLEDSWMIGDSRSDMEAGYKAGLEKMVAITDRPGIWFKENEWSAITCESLLEAVKYIMANQED